MKTAILNLKTMCVNINSAKSKGNWESSGAGLGQAQPAAGYMQMLVENLFSFDAEVGTYSFTLLGPL